MSTDLSDKAAEDRVPQGYPFNGNKSAPDVQRGLAERACPQLVADCGFGGDYTGVIL
jgi:hypothetical protein